jgi:hypothetical protein
LGCRLFSQSATESTGCRNLIKVKKSQQYFVTSIVEGEENGKMKLAAHLGLNFLQ